MAIDYVVSGAGTSVVNGTYLEDIVVNGKTSYKYEGAPTYYLFYKDSYWYIHDDTSPSGPTDSFYYIESSADEPPSSGWSTGSAGVEPFPTIAESQTYCLEFDGSDDYVDLGTSSDLKPTAALTVEVWANADNWQSASTGKFVSNTHVGGYGLSVRSTGIKFTVYSDGDYQQPSFSNSGYSGWHHIAGTFDGQYAKLYIDGILKNTVDMGTSGNAITYGYPNNSTLLGAEAGSSSTPDGSYFDGKFDDVRIWDVARTQAEIQEYICEDVSSESNLIAYYRMSNGSGTSLIDNSSTSYTGTLYDGGSVGNGPTWQTDYLVPSGDGTTGTEYQIQTLNHLWWLSQNSDEWGKLFEQTADIDMTVTQNWNDDHSGDPEGFSPIGLGTEPYFTGNYDGQENTISNLYIDRAGTSHQALFGLPHNATIANLGVVDCNITGNWTNGSLAGLTFEACYINNCFSTGSVTGAKYVGGLVGNNGASMTNCYSTVSVTVSSDLAGGLIGYNSAAVTNCYSSGSVSGSSSTIGGLVGDNGGTITNSFWDTQISGQSSSDGGTGKTTALMKTQSTFTDAGWDFTSPVWAITGGTNNGYPNLESNASTKSWIGGTTSYLTAWTTLSNWDDGILPTATDNISIPGNLTYNPTISGSTSAVCNKLVIVSSTGSGTNASLTIDYNGGLTVSNNLDNDGTLTINSTADGTGSLIVNGTATGDVIQERYIAAATWGEWDDGWHFLSSPVPDYPILSNFTVATTADYDFYAWSEVNNLWINFKTGDTPSFETVNGSNNFELGHGYLAAYKNTDTKEFTGTINVGDVSISNLDVTGSVNYYSWHLLGNPFTSALTWYTDWTTTSISGTAKIWNEGNKSYTTLSGGDPIPATNGFMVQATADDASLTIPASKRVHNSQAFYKNSRYEYPIMKLKANNMDNPSAQESEIRFNPESTNEWDMEFDSDFLSGYAPFFYSLIDDRPMAVNSMPDYSENTIIPFTFIKNEGLNFSIEMYEVENMDMDVWLYDNKLNKDHNLTQSPVYYFTAFENDNNERFVIHFSPLGIDDDVQTTAPTIQTYASNNTLYILNPEMKQGTVTLYNLTGQKVTTYKLSGDTKQQITINTNNMINIVKIQTDNEVISEKVIFRN